MKNLWFASVAGISLLAFSLAASGQDYYGGRGAFFRGERWHAHLFERVKQDVEHIRATTFPNGGGEFRLDRTISDLDDLQSKFARHFYDERALDRVIRSLNRVSAYNRMPPRDRAMLNDDVSRLREFRLHHEEWFRER